MVNGKRYSYLKIQYGGQNVILFVLSCHHSKICQKDSPHQNAFKLTLSRKSFYVFRKDRQCKFIFLLSPSLDLINIISVRALEAMKVAGETLQRSQCTLPAARSYLQPWVWLLIISLHFTSLHFTWFLGDFSWRGKIWEPWKRLGTKQQTQPTMDARSGNQTQAQPVWFYCCFYFTI